MDHEKNYFQPWKSWIFVKNPYKLWKTIQFRKIKFKKFKKQIAEIFLLKLNEFFLKVKLKVKRFVSFKKDSNRILNVFDEIRLHKKKVKKNLYKSNIQRYELYLSIIFKMIQKWVKVNWGYIICKKEVNFNVL